MHRRNYSFTVARCGTSLAYKAEGDGQGIIFTNGYATSDFYFKYLIASLSGRARLVTWDLKGHGASGPARDLERVTIADSALDIQSVMDAAELESALLVGFSLGCQIVFESWRHFPDRIDGMVAILGTYGKPMDGLLHPAVGSAAAKALEVLTPVTPPALKAVHKLSRGRGSHKLNQITGMVGRNVPRAEMMDLYNHFDQLHGPTWAAMGAAAQRHTAEDLLPTIDKPVLVIGGRRDKMTPDYLSQKMVDEIPAAELLMLDNATHTGLFDCRAEIEDAFEAFLAKHSLLPG